MNLKVVCYSFTGAGSITCRCCNADQPLEEDGRGYLIMYGRTALGLKRDGVRARVLTEWMWITVMNARNGAVIHSCNRLVHYFCPEHGEVAVKFIVEGPRRRRTPRSSIRDRLEVCPECLEPVTRHYEFVPLADYVSNTEL